MFDLNDVRFFLEVAQAGSFSGAARRLGVTQPTVGRRIQAMEDSLGARLFDRVQHGCALTLAGKDIVDAAGNIEENAWVIANKIMGDEDKLVGKVRLTTGEALAQTWVIDKLPLFRQLYPQLELDVLGGTSLDDLLRREADVALRIGTPGSDELVGQCLGKVGFGLYASKSYTKKFGEPSLDTDWSKHSIIESTGAIANLAQARKLRSLAKNANIALRTNNIATQVQAAVNSVGLAALPHYVTNNVPLERIVADTFDLHLDVWLLTHRDLRFTSRVRAVRDFLKEQVKSDLAV